MLNRQMPLDLPTALQLNQLAALIRGPIAKALEASVNDVTVRITCIPVSEDPSGAHKLRFEILVRGAPISVEQEERVSKLLRKSV